ncbi:MAG: 4-hydroxy-tetrahydrodipicolinate synthase [Chitinophagaceae bacterium]|nr:MAG: 4-hydroxy-tetrahydrodipicolinate synthase [Chitinophagaceae bacterium]
MQIEKFKGTGVALVTPFTKDGKIDFNSLEKVIENCISGKADYLVSLGTTGESVTLSKAEKSEVLAFTIEKVAGRKAVVVGCGGNNTQAVVEELKTLPKGVDGVLSVSPYYNKPNQNGIYAHYAHIAKSTSLSVILYNVPSRTGSNMTADTTLRLSEDFKNIIGIKEASGNIDQISEILSKRRPDFLVISGDDALTFPLLSLGIDGVISVVANAYPYLFSEMLRKTTSGKNKEAQQIHFRLAPIIELLFADGSPGGIKELLSYFKLTENNLRLPLWPVNEEVKKSIVKFASENPDRF